MDYRAWVERAQAFVGGLPRSTSGFAGIEIQAEVLPPLEAGELERLERAVTRPLPIALRQFYAQGSRHCHCRYVCHRAEGPDPWYGGASFLDALDLPQYLACCREWAEETWVAEFPWDRRLWLTSTPILAMENGDFLALEHSMADDPALVYLVHDEESFILAPSFTRFLDAWERVAYVGPEYWELDGLRNEQGFLDPNTDRAREIRRLFGLTEHRSPGS